VSLDRSRGDVVGVEASTAHLVVSEGFQAATAVCCENGLRGRPRRDTSRGQPSAGR
jgi:hypothetical protein